MDKHCVDFVVIGGGIAGATAALELSKIGTVAVLDMESTAGYHSTGRSAAITSVNFASPSTYALGVESLRFFLEPPEGFAEVPLATPRDILWIAQTGQEAAYQTMLSEVLERQYQVKELDASEALKLCPILREDRLWKALLELDGYDLDVHAIHHGCLKALKQSGGKVFLNSEVYTMTLAEGTWEIRSSHGTFATRVVVNAAGAWADIVASRAGIRPLGFKALRRTALTFDAPAGADHAAWPFVYDIEEKFYFKLEHGQILASPADETELPACDVSYDDLDIAVAADRIQNVARIEISHVRNKWAGFRVFSPDRDLVIGEDDSAPGFYWLAGQGGVGIMTAPGAALALASMVEQRPLPASLTTLGLTQAMLSPTRFTNG